MVANGTEGEPASTKDKALLTGSPHLVLDGARLAAETVGAGEVIICVDASATAAVAAVRAALVERARVHADRVTWRLEAAPGRYVAGEESALVHWLGGGDAKPTYVPPRPFERGVRGRPTLVNNVETLAHLALIARFGATWYRGLGTAEDPGTALVTLSGDVPRPGLYEIPWGLPLVELLGAAGAAGSTPPGVLIGGYAGTWVPGRLAVQLTVDTPSLGRVGAGLGCGAISVLGPDRCPLAEVARVTRWLAEQSAGQCGPCVHGLPAIATRSKPWSPAIGRRAGRRSCAAGSTWWTARHVPPPRRGRSLRTQRPGRLRRGRRPAPPSGPLPSGAAPVTDPRSGRRLAMNVKRHRPAMNVGSQR